LLEDYYNITEDEVSEMLDMFMFELSDDANENLGIDIHVELFINKLNCHFETK
jgi:hypothetical protein